MEETIGYEAFSPEEWGSLDSPTREGPVRTTHLCRCSRGNDMNCPLSEPLSELTQHLEARGYVKEIHVVDAMWRRACWRDAPTADLAVASTRCGFRRKKHSRVFWIRRTCSHWTEV